MLMPMLLMTSASSQASRPQELRLRISFEKSTYSADQPIVCRVLVENVSDSHVSLNSRMLVNVSTGPHELTFRILGPDKKTVPFTSKIRASFAGDQFTLLLPGQVAGVLYDLTKDHELSQRGSYTVQAFYENHSDAPASMNFPATWKGTLESNRASFTLQ